MNRRSRLILPFFVILVSLVAVPASAQDWLRRFNAAGSAIDEAGALVPAGGGAVLAVGSSLDTTNSWDSIAEGWNVVAVLYEAGGAERWRLQFDGGSGRDEKAFCGGLDASGNTYIAGCAFDSLGGWDILLLKADASGKLAWSRRWGGLKDERAVAMRVDMQGNSYVAGMSMSSAGIANLVVIKFDAAGTVEWANRYDTDQEIDPAAMDIDPWGNVLVVGTRGRTATELFVAKYSFAGVLRWSRSVTGGTGSAEGAAVATDGVGNVFAAGSTTVSNSSDALLMKFGSDGTLAWTRRYNGTGNDADAATAVAVDADGNAYLAARSKGGASGPDVVTVKYQPNGSEEWVARHSGSGNALDRNPPLFGGASGATFTSDGVATVHWARAADDLSPARAITYRVYVAIAPGAYDYGTPQNTVRNGQSTAIPGLLRGHPYYVLVRATDEAGNTDGNMRELRVVVPQLPRRDLIVTRDTVLPHGIHVFDAVTVREDATLYLNGDVRLYANDSIAVHGTLRSDCWPIDLRSTGSLVITGRIDNRASDADSIRPASIFLCSSEGKALLWSSTPESGIFSHGSITLTDDSSFAAWKLAVTPFGQSAAPLRPAALLNADVVQTTLEAGVPLPLRFRVTAFDPDGSAVSCDIDFGDGSTQANIPVADIDALVIEKAYTRPGVYLPQITVRDNEGSSSVSALQLVVGDSATAGSLRPGLQIVMDRIAAIAGDSVVLEAAATPCAGSSIDSVRWDFGDGSTAEGRSLRHAWSATGVYHVVARAFDDSGRIADAVLSLYVYEPDTTNLTGTLPTTSARPAETTVAASRAASAPQPSGLVIIDMPFVAGRGNRIYFEHQDVTFYSHAALIGGKGVDGLPGRAAADGAGARCWSNGSVTVNGGLYASGDGGVGPGGGLGSHGRSGGRGGELVFRARDLVLNGGSFSSGHGGRGGTDVKTGGTGIPACAIGGSGGSPGVLSFHAARGLTLQSLASIELGRGGDGGAVYAEGGAGTDHCPLAGSGGAASARGGDGGRTSSISLLRGTLSGVAYTSVSGGSGGTGGDATAIGGLAGNASGCTATATGGVGGHARASGGAGGNSGDPLRGLQVNAAPAACTGGNGGAAAATGGFGGDARATGSPDPGMYGCPGQNGGDAAATGGNGGNAFAMRGLGGRSSRGDGAPGSSEATGSNGGLAEARGGNGGYGTGCNCVGGNGGRAEANAGRAGATGAVTQHPGRDGNADAFGGSGGEGGDCCSQFQPVDGGGVGGNGGNASAVTGATGGNTGKGGKAGEGGDGCPRRDAGRPGTGTGSPAAIAGGDSAAAGAPCCPIPARTFIHGFCSNIIAPGQGYTWDIYDSLQSHKVGSMVATFMTELEAGKQVIYSCYSILSQITIQYGGIKFDMGSVIDATYPSRSWKCLSFRLEYQATDSGTVMLMGLRNSTVSDQQIKPFAAGPGSVTVTAPPGTQFDLVSVLFQGPVKINWWGITAVFIGPQ